MYISVTVKTRYIKTHLREIFLPYFLLTDTLDTRMVTRLESTKSIKRN